MSERVDVVYTWVDDSLPGYLDLLRAHAQTGHDLNPNRTRDNLDLLRYSLRSLRHAPWLGRIYLLTMRPQVPAWLREHEGLRVVHHDEVMDPEHLPTFNSFAIVAHVHRLPGLSERFLYLCDDYLLGAAVRPEDLWGPARDPVYLETRGWAAAPTQRHSTRISPWNAGLAHTNHLLDRAFGRARRRRAAHAPLAIRRSWWSEMLARWEADVARTRASRFRARYDLVPEYLYPHFLLATGRGEAVSPALARRRVLYHNITNLRAWAWWGTRALRRRRAQFVALNDDFGAHPNPRVVARWRRALAAAYPQPSPHERRE